MATGIEWNDGLDCWVVSDLALARDILSNPGFSSGTFERSFQLYMAEDARQHYQELTDFLCLWFVQCDGAEHLILRRPVTRTLSASHFRSMRPRIEEIVEAALDDLAAAATPDVVPMVADAVSARVMAHLVGLNEESVEGLHDWSRALSAFIGAMYNRRHADSASAATRRVTAEFEAVPTIISTGCPASPAGKRELATWAMIVFGGLETTSSLLGSIVLRVLSDPQAWQEVAADQPGAVDGLVESVLETQPPLRNLGRVVAYDQEFAGHQMRAGSLVLVSLVGANLLEGTEHGTRQRSPASGGERHVTFGHGPHYCIGAALARLEAEVLIRRFVRRFPGARLADGGAVWRPNLSYIGLDHLCVELEPTMPRPLSDENEAARRNEGTST